MSVEIYTPFDTNGNPTRYKKQAEMEAAYILARSIWRQYRQSPNYYLIVLNPEPYDVVIFTQNGFGVIDFKSSQGRMTGSEDSYWHYANGRQVMAGSKHINPFVQVQTYRDTIETWLDSLTDLPIHRFIEGKHVQAALVFTGAKVDTSQIQISPANNQWFRMLTLEQVPVWIDTLACGSDLRLSPEHLRQLAQRLDSTIAHWDDFMAQMEHPGQWGYLNVINNGQPISRFVLTDDSYIVGRQGTIKVPADRIRTSREHALIRRGVENHAYIRNLSSTSPLWVSDLLLEHDEERQLQSNVRIILGNRDGQYADAQSYEMEFQFAMESNGNSGQLTNMLKEDN